MKSVKALSSTDDPREMVQVFGEEVGSLLERDASLSMTRRHVPAPQFQISRYSEWEEPIDPWLDPDKLPVLEGGILGDLIFNNRAVVLVDYDLDESDPAYEYLKGYRSLLSLPTFDNREALNMTVLLSKDPEAFDEELLPEIVWTGNLFGRAIHNLRVGDALKEAHRKIDHEVKVVAGIQLSLLPNGLPEIPGVELAVHYEAAEQAGGDYYDFFELPSGKWGLLIADVSGHGPSAAVLMAITHSIAHTNPDINDDPASMLDFINHHLILRYTNITKTFVTAFYAVYDPETHLMRYASAGHDSPLVLHSTDCTFDVPEATKNMPLGIRESKSYETYEFALQPGDFLVLFTDGIFEARNSDGELFGIERFTESVRQCTETPAHIIESLLQDLKAFAGNEPTHDDQTLLIAKIEG
ncbi:MAG: PP2C family protein-serine/threonine phosphatase [Candidatus Hydrogenedentota bacterium]